MAVECTVAIPIGIRRNFRNGVNVASFDVASEGIRVGVMKSVLSFSTVPGGALAIIDANHPSEFVQIPYLQQAEECDSNFKVRKGTNTTKKKKKKKSQKKGIQIQTNNTHSTPSNCREKNVPKSDGKK